MREGVLVLQPRIKKVKLEKPEPGIRRSESAMSVSSEASSSSESVSYTHLTLPTTPYV